MLIAPLDWGLGHTTRCIPLIQYLLQKNCQITIAGTDQQFAILKSQFPDAEYLPLPGYEIAYPRNYKRFKRKLLYQLPRLLQRISYERRWLAHHHKNHGWAAVISDNRFGFSHPDVYSVFITHQLQIITGIGSAADGLLRKINYRFIRKFDECWIPDVSSGPSLAGTLSHPGYLPGNEKYIGPLSRFEQQESDEKSDLLILLSGPEPQRTIFEELILKQFGAISGKIILVRGRPLATDHPTAHSGVTILNSPAGAELQRLMNGAKMILCRSGYTTVMDLIRLKKRALLVPTPGQTEQEYLAHHLHEEGLFYNTVQSRLQLETDLAIAEKFHRVDFPDHNFGLYRQAVDDLLVTLSSRHK